MAEEADKNISDLRDKIDKLDVQIVELLNKRAELAFEIRELKNKEQIPVYDAEREEEIFRKVIDSSDGPLADDILRCIYQEILRSMKNFE